MTIPPPANGPPLEADRCCNCRFFATTTSHEGQCRKEPPRCFLRRDWEHPVAFHPWVSASSWCGRHERKRF